MKVTWFTLFCSSNPWCIRHRNACKNSNKIFLVWFRQFTTHHKVIDCSYLLSDSKDIQQGLCWMLSSTIPCIDNGLTTSLSRLPGCPGTRVTVHDHIGVSWHHLYGICGWQERNKIRYHILLCAIPGFSSSWQWRKHAEASCMYVRAHTLYLCGVCDLALRLASKHTILLSGCFSFFHTGDF